MMNIKKKILVISLLTASSNIVRAVESTDLTVKGIINPTACNLQFSGAGVVDYGIIPAASIEKTQSLVTKLEEKSFDYTITCQAPITIGMRWKDQREGTALPRTINSYSAHAFGLGVSGTSKIGGYTLSRSEYALADGSPRRLITKYDNNSWIYANSLIANGNAGNASTISSFAMNNTSIQPGQYKDYSGEITVSPVVSNDLNRNDSITLDGLATMTIEYL